MLYRDDDDGLLYVMQSVTTQRGFIVAWVARVSVDGKVGPTEGRPVHVPEVARMVLDYQRKETPWILGAGEWHKITVGRSVELSGASEVLTPSTDDGQQTTSGRRSGSLSQVVKPAQERVTASSSGADHPSTTEPRRRDRKRRTPLNVGVLGDTSGGIHSAKIARAGGEGSIEYDLDPSTIYHMHHVSQEVSLEE